MNNPTANHPDKLTPISEGLVEDVDATLPPDGAQRLKMVADMVSIIHLGSCPNSELSLTLATYLSL